MKCSALEDQSFHPVSTYAQNIKEKQYLYITKKKKKTSTW